MRRLLIRGLVWVEFCGIQIAQLIELDGGGETTIQGVLFLQSFPHHANMRTGDNKRNIGDAVVNNALKNGVNRCGLVHRLQVRVFIDDNHHLLRQCIEVGEYILQRRKLQRHGQDLRPNQLLHKPVNIVLQCALQALKIDFWAVVAFQRFLNQRGLSDTALPIDHYGFADIILLQKRQFLLTTNKHRAPPAMLNLFSLKMLSVLLYHLPCKKSSGSPMWLK